MIAGLIECLCTVVPIRLHYGVPQGSKNLLKKG